MITEKLKYKLLSIIFFTFKNRNSNIYYSQDLIITYYYLLWYAPNISISLIIWNQTIQPQFLLPVIMKAKSHSLKSCGFCFLHLLKCGTSKSIILWSRCVRNVAAVNDHLATDIRKPGTPGGCSACMGSLVVTSQLGLRSIDPSNHRHSTWCWESLTALQMERLLQSLGDIGKSNSKCLYSSKRVLKIQCVGIAVNTPKLHHLKQTTDRY